MVVNFYVLVAEIHFIFATRNAWVGDLVCLCVMEDKSCVEQWMVEGATTLNGQKEVRIKSSVKKKRGKFFLVCIFFLF
jgi:hypothetical protein